MLTSARLGSLCVSGSASVTLWCRRKTKTEWHTAKQTLFGHKQVALVSLSLSASPIWILTIESCVVYTKLPTLRTFCVWPHGSLCVTNWIYAPKAGAKVPPSCGFAAASASSLSLRVCATKRKKLNKTVGELLCVKNYYFRREWITRVWIAPFLVLQGVREAISCTRPARQCK